MKRTIMIEQKSKTSKQIKKDLVDLAVTALRHTKIASTFEESLDVVYEKRKFRQYIMDYLTHTQQKRKEKK